MKVIGEFSKNAIQMPGKHFFKCLTPLFIKETQIKTTLRFLFATVRMVKINKRMIAQGRINGTKNVLKKNDLEIYYCNFTC